MIVYHNCSFKSAEPDDSGVGLTVATGVIMVGEGITEAGVTVLVLFIKFG